MMGDGNVKVGLGIGSDSYFFRQHNRVEINAPPLG
jgi:hypothetical protein